MSFLRLNHLKIKIFYLNKDQQKKGVNMYLEKINIQNYGPLKHFVLDMPFNKDENGNKTTPKPLVIVGKNGTGKTVILSHIVNGLIALKQNAYDDNEVERNFVYKIRSPFYINNARFYYARLDYTNNVYSVEYQLSDTKSNIEKIDGFTKPNEDWNLIQNAATDYFSFNPRDKIRAKELIDNNILKYFPSDRTTLPAWLNEDALIKPQRYSNRQNFSNISNRNILYTNDFEDNKSWLMDLLYDKEVYDKKCGEFVLPDQKQPDGTILRTRQQICWYQGLSEDLYQEILKIINVIFGNTGKKQRIGIGPRNNRQLSIIDAASNVITLPNISQLSLGESLLLNLFLSIIKDADYNGKNYKNLSEMEGIVLIDEIENHLHNYLVSQALPKLIRLFPRIQFIITSHSPIFLLGMDKEFKEGYQIIELDKNADNGYETKSAEGFSEFKEAFDVYQNTYAFYSQVVQSNKPVILTEGKTDPKIINKAWTELNPGVEIPFDVVGLSEDTGGSGANALSNLMAKMPNIPNKKIIGIFDADGEGKKYFDGLGQKQGFVPTPDIPDIKTQDKNVYILQLPIPQAKIHMKDKAEGFEIEDYFPDDLLESVGKSSTKVNLVKDNLGNETVDTNLSSYRKFHGNKAQFAETVISFDNADNKFDNFKCLFEKLGKIIDEQS